MAHGETLELREIPRRTMRKVCICGSIWEEHFDKRGKKLLKRFNNDAHKPAGLGGFAQSYARRKQ